MNELMYSENVEHVVHRALRSVLPMLDVNPRKGVTIETSDDPADMSVRVAVSVPQYMGKPILLRAKVCSMDSPDLAVHLLRKEWVAYTIREKLGKTYHGMRRPPDYLD